MPRCKVILYLRGTEQASVLLFTYPTNHMIRKSLFLVVLAIILAIAANPILAKRPNIILILTDDQDKESIGAYGGDVWTPNLDRMAKEGMLFHNGFVTSTVCTPSRYAFLTGRYPSRSSSEVFMEENPEGQQAFPSFNMGLEPDNMNVAAVLSKAGYRTGFVGKYHASGVEGLRNQSDYEAYGLKYIARNAKASDEINEAFRFNELQYRKLLTDRGFDWAKNIYMGNLQKPYNEHNLEWTVDAALEFIEESANTGKDDEPFYLHFCTTLVHGLDGSWSRAIEEPLVSGSGVLESPIQPEEMLSRKEILSELKLRGLDPTKGHAGYSWVDAGVGAILAKLKKLGIDDNTLVIFTADHGSRLKGSLYDIDGASVPFIIRWPGKVEAGIKSAELVQSIDIAATAFDLGEATLPKQYALDGHSMTPLFGGQSPKSWRDHLYLELGFSRAIRTKELKYIATRYPKEHLTAIRKGDPKKLPALLAPINRAGIGTRGSANPNFYYDDALFRIDKDKREMKNLVNDPEYSVALKEMKQLLIQTIETTDRPYGELVPGGNATAPGQVSEQQELTRRMEIKGKTVTLPN